MFDTSVRPLLPENIANLKPYIAGKTIAEVREAYQPKQISKLASNENRLGCSPLVKAAVEQALTEVQDYPDPVSSNLRSALAEKNNVAPENILVAAGSESIIAILCRTFFRKNEKAMTADATFVGFFVHANIEDISYKTVPITSDYRFDTEAIADGVTDQTKMIYIANPNNPTGTYITKTEFKSMMERIPDDVLVIMDEAYYEFAETVDDYPHTLDYGYDNVISLRTFSKAYGLAGFRVGYAIGHQDLIGSMMKTKLTFEPTALGQAAALEALNDDEFLERSKEVVHDGRERLYDFFKNNNVEYVRSVSNSVLMVCEDVDQARSFTQKMLEEGVILRRVNAFGLPNSIRITIGTEEEMQHFEDSFKSVGF